MQYWGMTLKNKHTTVSFKALSDLSFLETCARNFFCDAIYNVAYSFPGSFGKSVTVTAIRHGHTGHNKPLSVRKKVERLEKTEKDRDSGDTCTEFKSKETLQTQTPEIENVIYVRGQHKRSQ